MEPGNPLQDYPDRTVGTTWAISYNTVRGRGEDDLVAKTAANLLLLWAFLNHRDLWHRLFVAAYNASTFTAQRLLEWIGDSANGQLEFTMAMQLLRNYSLIEEVEDLATYATHPVVHRWMYHFIDNESRKELAQLAVIVVGWALPSNLSRDYSSIQRRLLPHAQICYRWVLGDGVERRCRNRDTDEMDADGTKETEATLDAVHLLGLLYSDQGKLAEAEKMYQRALDGKEKALGPEHTSTLDTVNNLRLLNLSRSESKSPLLTARRALGRLKASLWRRKRDKIGW